MSDEQSSKRTATEAMRLKPAAQRPRPGVDPAVAAERAAAFTAGRADAFDAIERTLDELVDELVDALSRLHAPLELSASTICRECLTLHPCRTMRLVHPGTEGAPPREDSTQ